MDTIYKYQLSEDNVETMLRLPAGAIPLHVAEQQGKVCLWAQVDTDITLTEPRRFVVVGTGKPIPSDAVIHVGSFLTPGGWFVFHVFEAILTVTRDETMAQYRQWRAEVGVPIPGDES